MDVCIHAACQENTVYVDFFYVALASNSTLDPCGYRFPTGKALAVGCTLVRVSLLCTARQR
jgi:hypothetical protein